MILVDTSTVIDLLKDENNPKVLLFNKILTSGTPFGISIFTYQEILQGCKEHEVKKIETYLSSQTIYTVPQTTEFFGATATLYRKFRLRGITIRSTIDVLIAMTAIRENLTVLHNDRDFDLMALHEPALKILDN